METTTTKKFDAGDYVEFSSADIISINDKHYKGQGITVYGFIQSFTHDGENAHVKIGGGIAKIPLRFIKHSNMN